MALEHEAIYFIACDWCQERGPEIHGTEGEISPPDPFTSWNFEALEMAKELAREAGFVFYDNMWLCKVCHIDWRKESGN